MLEERGAVPPVGHQHAHGRTGIAERLEHVEVRLPYVVGRHVVALHKLRNDPRDDVNRFELVADA